MGLNDRDYMREVPIYRDLVGRRYGGGLPPSTTETGGWSSPPRPPRRMSGYRRTRPWAWVALGALATLAVLMRVLPSTRSIAAPISAVGRRPVPTNVLPAAPERVPAPRSYPITGPTTATTGSTFTATGTLDPSVSGVVTVEAQWGSGPWYRLATASAVNGGYRIRYELPRPGVVHLRIALPDGNDAVTTITVVDPPHGSGSMSPSA
jgi:hypothetical protein